MEAKLKHLEFIQGAINRLAGDSFRMKGWAVVLVSALLVLLVRERRVELAWIGFVPVLVFWGLDGYFLWQERLFRELYDHVRTLDESAVDFSMNVGAFKRTWLEATFSIMLVPFYVALALSARGGDHQLNTREVTTMTRRVFFGFEYQHDVWRANIVRNSWVAQGKEAVGFVDAADFEEVKKVVTLPRKLDKESALWHIRHGRYGWFPQLLKLLCEI